MSKKNLLQRTPSPTKHFKLLRRFSIVSLLSVTLATAFLAAFYRHQATRDLIISAEDSNVEIATIFSNTLWRRYKAILPKSQTLTATELKKYPRNQRLLESTIKKFGGLSIVKIKIFDLEGKTFFSTDFSQVGEDKSQSPGFIAANSGQVKSFLGHRETFASFNTTIKNRHLLSSYVPLYQDEDSEEIIGVFELYRDITPVVSRIEQTQSTILLGSLCIQAILYGALFLFVKNADYVLKAQYQQVQDSNHLYRQQASELDTALTDLKQAQSQMLQTEKMSGLGQMVAGIAHEINNPVNFIHGNLTYIREYVDQILNLLQMYREQYPDPVPEIQDEIEEIELDFIEEDLTKILDSISLGSTRIGEVILALRTFSRLDEAEVKSVDIQEGLESTLMILGHRLTGDGSRDEIQVIESYDSSLPPIECHAGLLNQVFMNILSNSIDALREKFDRQDKARDIPQIKIEASWLNEEWVKISMSDNGVGIALGVQKHIFEPFFTTKAVGKGTGLGMSISHQIITDQHHGKLRCVSTEGEGTTFTIQIPIRYKLKGTS